MKLKNYRICLDITLTTRYQNFSFYVHLKVISDTFVDIEIAFFIQKLFVSPSS